MTDNTGSVTTGTPAANTADTTTASTTTATTTNDSWTASFTNPETKGFAELRGWKSPEQAVESFRQLEKFQGVPAERLAKIPEADDKAGWAEFNKKFGWAAPEKAEDYGLTSIEGFDAGFLTEAEKRFHALGIPKDLANNAMKNIGEVLADFERQAEQARVTAHNNEVAQLDAEWGANAPSLKELGKRAQAEFMPKIGLGDADMDAIRDAIGSAKFNKFWAGIGSTMGEAAFHQGDKVQTGVMTPDAAKARLAELSADTAWFHRKEAGGVKENQEYNNLKMILANATLSPR